MKCAACGYDDSNKEEAAEPEELYVISRLQYRRDDYLKLSDDDVKMVLVCPNCGTLKAEI
jgi:rubredoxin